MLYHILDHNPRTGIADAIEAPLTGFQAWQAHRVKVFSKIPLRVGGTYSFLLKRKFIAGSYCVAELDARNGSEIQ